ncbi:MAG: hypothetical protein ACI8WY_000332, partial [Planctomycetota bacterium]
SAISWFRRYRRGALPREIAFIPPGLRGSGCF